MARVLLRRPERRKNNYGRGVDEHICGWIFDVHAGAHGRAPPPVRCFATTAVGRASGTAARLISMGRPQWTFERERIRPMAWNARCRWQCLYSEGQVGGYRRGRLAAGPLVTMG